MALHIILLATKYTSVVYLWEVLQKYAAKCQINRSSHILAYPILDLIGGTHFMCQVEPVELERVLLEAAYMLLYARYRVTDPTFSVS